jgi:hypothetical protein
MALGVLAAASLACRAAGAAPWIAADWAGKEPSYPAGSLFWKTGEYPQCPVLFRTLVEVEDRPIAFGGFTARASSFAYVFLNGRQIASHVEEGGGDATSPFGVELTHVLRPGRNVLVISTGPEGLALEGGIGYQGGRLQRFGTDVEKWRVQKLPPLTMLEYEPCMEPGFDDTSWFAVKASDGEEVRVPDDALRESCQRLAGERLGRWDADARWRLQMLGDKGIAIVDWEAFGWAGAGRLPEWLREAAREEAKGEGAPGWYHERAEALTRYARLSDEETNLRNYAVGLRALGAPDADAAACRTAAGELAKVVERMRGAIQQGKPEQAAADAAKGEAIASAARTGRLISRFCSCIDNKFGWFDTTGLLDNDIPGWGLHLASPAEAFASPLSPAALVTVTSQDLVVQGWDQLQPLRVYNKPPALGPVCLWVVLDGKVVSLRPGDGGVAYDQAANGKLSENWALLVNDLSKGGGLPIELVFLQAPSRIAFKAGEKGTSEVTVSFERPGARLFMLRPLKEWRGLLQEARVMTQEPLNEGEAERYVKPCRLWSRALLSYPVAFSEAFIRDPEDKWALTVADVYNYQDLEDEWGTEPMRLAPLPPLATYGLMMDYPGLKVIGDAEVLGSRGVWGDEVAAVGTDHIVYRVPLDPIKRFGGFTSYCFGPTDIGSPGNIKELETIERTGANTFRPQHNQTGERAMKTVQWCWEQGLQNVFNTDEKWVPDVCEHYRTLAEQCKGYPPDAVAYDLLNEPETRDPRAYNALIRKTTAAIRAVDRTHLIYVEVIPPWGPGAQPYPQGAFENLEPTGDALTCYSFHDYEYRLPPRWPNEEHDARTLLARWIPAFRFSIDHRCPIHLGEFGGFEQTKESVYDNRCAVTLMMDYLRIFDQFGWHWHYYANRGIVRVRKDGSLEESCVQEACRRCLQAGTWNVNRRG